MKHHLPITITKMSGAGNTFALLDGRDSSAWIDVEKHLGMSRSQFAKLVCDRVSGVATDGFIIIHNGPSGFDFEWDFYNSDGSFAEMCGNATRCAARFCYENLLDAKGNGNIKFKTGAGLVTAQILGNGKIRVLMPEARMIQEHIELQTVSSSTETFSYVNSGVPHLVQKIHNFSDTLSLKEMAREIRHHESLKPAGANVTFYSEEQPGRIRAVTFERGVEDYTLACGTGAVASALVYSKLTGNKDIEVQMPGGGMEVHFLENDMKPILIGSAIFIGDFQYNLEVIR